MKLPLGDKTSLKTNIFFACLSTISIIGLILLIQFITGECFVVAMWDIGWAGYWILSWIFIFYPLGILEFSVCFFPNNDRRTRRKAVFGQDKVAQVQLGRHQAT